MENIIIESATAEDTPSILELLYELGRPRPQGNDNFGDIVGIYIVDPYKDIIVAKSNNEVIGMASLVFLPRLNYYTLEMYIPELVVSQKYQNKRIGRKIITECIRIAKERNCHRIRLESGKDRVNAYGFYIYLGFENNSESFAFDLSENN